VPTRPTRKPLASRLRLKHLKLAQQVFEQHTLRAAAEASNMSQSAATKLLQELEEMYAVPLFQRSKHGMRPTSYGDVVKRHIEVLLADMERMEQEIALVAQGGFGRIRLGVLPSVPDSLLNGAINVMLSEYPGVRFSIYEADSNDLLASLQRNELDVTFARVLDRDMTEGVRAIRVYDQSFLIVSRPGHPLARIKRLSWEQLSEATLILPAQGTPLRNFINECFSRNAAFHPTVAVECSTVERVRSLVLQSDMIAVLARSFVTGRRGQDKLAILDCSLGPNFASTSLVLRQRSELAPVVEAFCRVVRTNASELRLSS